MRIDLVGVDFVRIDFVGALQSVILLLSFHSEWGSYVLHECVNIYKVCVSPALNGSSAIWCFEHGDAVEIFSSISTRDCHICYKTYKVANVSPSVNKFV